MMLIIVIVSAVLLPVAAISPEPRLVGSPYLQCKVYGLAHEFALKVLPSMTPVQSAAVYDALRLERCNGSSSPTTHRGQPGVDAATVNTYTIDASVNASAETVEVFADAIKGNDNAAGTAAAPLRTVAAALALVRRQRTAAAAGTPAIITLRGSRLGTDDLMADADPRRRESAAAATYYLRDTLELTALDSGLTIRSFKGEQARLSAAAPLPKEALQWEPYNVSCNDTRYRMLRENQTNLVFGATFGANSSAFSYVGKMPNADACSDLCLHDAGCDAFTWHDTQQAPGNEKWSQMCYFVNRGQAYSSHTQTMHTSGVKQRPEVQNVWVSRNALRHAGLSFGENIDGMRVGDDGIRAIRARWPNGNPETQLFPDGWSVDHVWAPPRLFPPAEDIVVTDPNRSALGPCGSSSGYCNYVTGVGGSCAGYGFEPASGYWCANSPPRGKVYHVAFPSAITSQSGSWDSRRWRSFKANETVVNAFRSGHWFSYVFLVDAVNETTGALSWTVGGFQGGEGAPGADEFNIENVLDELDAPMEWYADRDTGDLYFYPNETCGTPPAANVPLAFTRLQQLITITGGGSARGDTAPHATNITLSGLKFSDAAMTTLVPHGLPSDGGGDWAIARRAAVHLTGVEGTTITNCTFERIDGNGVMISGYSRDTAIVGNEFRWVGENAIVSWGYTADFPDANRTIPIPKGQGGDARDGNHPLRNRIESNFIHEIGHFQKQVSCYFQAQTVASLVKNNVCFNGPRAGFNVNDGMGGGSVFEQNLIFNMVRETQDHGTFNSWNRQPFYVTRDGVDTYVPAYNEIKGNFWMNDYNSQEATDNDDNSAYYNTHHNFFPFSSGGLKNDFGGHDNYHHNNLYINSGTCMSVCAQKPGHEDAFYNNTCALMASSPTYANFQPGIGGDAYPKMHDNRVFTANGEANEAGKTVAEWQAQGHDMGTTVAYLPADDDLVAMARGLLQLDE